jgi:addiction module RelE/StbE family toxin
VKIIWSPLAVDRVAEIAEYIALDKPSAAEKWVESIFNSVKRLEQFPDSGRIIPEIQLKNFREIILGNYHIIYRIEENKISVLTMRSGKQILPVDKILE